jgi:transcriptional regulator with XRE-family HTH domain
MSELSNKIKLLRGDRSAEDIAKEVGVSRESFSRIERGGSVKLSTLKQIATALRVPESDWLELLVAWLKSEAGPDARKLWLEPRETTPSVLRDKGDNEAGRAMMLFNSLNPAERQEIMKAMERPEVRRCLPAINRVWEKFDQKDARSVGADIVNKAAAAHKRSTDQ